MVKEAQARIKINKRLEESGWRFEANRNGPANINSNPCQAPRFKSLGLNVLEA